MGKGYVSEGLFKMNVMTIVPHVSMNEENTSSAYIVESSYIPPISLLFFFLGNRDVEDWS